MDKQTKRILCYIAFGVGLFALLNNLGSVWAVVKTGASFLVPVFGGLLVAFILSVPMKGFENLLLRLLPKDRRPRETALQAAGLLLTLLSVVVVLVLAFTLVIPEIARSVRTIAEFLAERPEDSLPQEIRLVCFSDASRQAHENALQRLREKLAAQGLE